MEGIVKIPQKARVGVCNSYREFSSLVTSGNTLNESRKRQTAGYGEQESFRRHKLRSDYNTVHYY